MITLSADGIKVFWTVNVDLHRIGIPYSLSLNHHPIVLTPAKSSAKLTLYIHGGDGKKEDGGMV